MYVFGEQIAFFDGVGAGRYAVEEYRPAGSFFQVAFADPEKVVRVEAFESRLTIEGESSNERSCGGTASPRDELEFHRCASFGAIPFDR